MDQKIICIVAGQRSGTTALRSMLGATGRIRNFGEIFHTDELDKEGNYFGYCRERKLLISDICSENRVLELAAEYVEFLRRTAGEKHVLIDVKFNSWRPLTPAWSYLQEEPTFLAFLKRIGATFIFLQRLDIAEQIVSEAIARATDKWHNLSEQDLAAAHVTVSEKKARRQARLICLSENYFWNALKDYRSIYPLVYENLFVNSILTEEAKATLSQMIGEPLPFPESPAIRKNSSDKSRTISNYDEVKRAVSEVTATLRRPQF